MLSSVSQTVDSGSFTYTAFNLMHFTDKLENMSATTFLIGILVLIKSTLQSSAPSSLKIKFKMNLVETKTTVITGKPDQDKRILRKIWSNAITTQTKLELITRLCNLNLGFKGIEDFCNLQVGELQSKNFQEKFGRIRAKNIELIMKNKMHDAEEDVRKAMKEKERAKKELDQHYGINSRKCRNVVKKINKEMRTLLAAKREKNNKKVDWLLKKYRKEEEKISVSLFQKMLMTSRK